MTDEIKFTYDLSLNKNETLKLELPNLRHNNMIISKVDFSSNSNEYEAKLCGKDTIAIFNEALFFVFKDFDLKNYQHLISDSECIYFNIKNLITVKDKLYLKLKLNIYYTTVDPYILYTNVIKNPTHDTLLDIIKEINNIKNKKKISNIVFTTDNNLNFIKFTAVCESSQLYFKDYLFKSDNPNNECINYIDCELDIKLVTNIIQYKIEVPEDIIKLGVIIYGI